MSNFSNYGGLTSNTGSIGGGGDGNNHRNDRGIFFPEFDQWAQNEGAILKVSTSAKLNKLNGISESITIDVNFNDDAWRPASQVLAYGQLPKIGSQHPTISRCTLKNVSIKSYNNQHDHFRANLEYEYENFSINFAGGNQATPIDEPFTISWTPTIVKQDVGEDLNGDAIRNPNGEPYKASVNKVRLDGVCTWNQLEWDELEASKWTGVLNRGTWVIDDYKFESETVLCNYVIGNLKFYTDDNGQRIAYYEMQAGISFNPERWSDTNEGNSGEGLLKFRRQGSYYYNTNSPTRNKDNNQFPKPKSRLQYDEYDLDEDGVLLTKDGSRPTSPNPEYDYFKLYNVVNFNFVDK